MARKGEDKAYVKELTSKREDFAQWYVDVIRKTDMADYTTLKGCMVIKPYGFALWEGIRQALDQRIRRTGHKNAYFPLFVPESLLKLEADHVKGFAPEVAWVTKGGSEELEEPLAIRPTSEAIICSIYAKWVQSYRDLPILINQWANVVRWEKVTRLFLRTTEFLWQEGHTCHRTQEEAQEETIRMLEVYREFAETELAMPVLYGEKTDSEKFAGAQKTYAIEALMADGKALQAGTSHNLGQHFAKVFQIKFLDEDQKEKYVWQTSWGVSTRLIGGVVMMHGDDYGLALPPRIAPVQVVFVPIYFSDSMEEVIRKVKELGDKLGAYRVELDLRDTQTAGWKFNEWEMKGVPLRIEVGPKDIKKKQVVMVRRDTREKTFVPEERFVETVGEQLEDIQRNLFQRALDFRKDNTSHTDDYGEFKEIIERKRGFIVSGWCGDPLCEAKVKEDTKATIRCLPLEELDATGARCLACGKPAAKRAYFARAY
ncbi:proline--tRNA ligase [Candidatus Sumerlaeota bacterium]|nr:proline--tRNA ligase [Candidatus Sumerlaeota bacterium]